MSLCRRERERQGEREREGQREEGGERAGGGEGEEVREKKRRGQLKDTQ